MNNGHAMRPHSDVITADDDSLRGQLAPIWRWKWVVLACLLVFPIGAFVISSQATKVYRAAATVSVQPGSTDTSLIIANVSPAGVPDESLSSAAGMAQTSAVTVPAAAMLKPPLSPPVLSSKLSISTDATSGFLSIKATDHSPDRAAAIANAVAKSLTIAEANQAQGQIDFAIAQLQQQLARVSPQDGAQRLQVSDELGRLRALRAAQPFNTRIVQEAQPPSGAISPTPSRDAILGVIAGALVGIALVYLLAQLDRKVRDPLEFESLAGVPLLAEIPNNAFPNQPQSSGVADAFQTLRGSLVYFNVDRPLTTILIASPAPSEGKTTVGSHLAEAFARSGKDVVVVDTDLRYVHTNPVYRGSNAEHGLGSVLAGESTVDEVLVGEEHLHIVPSGPPPPNPSELIASDRMRNLLSDLAERFDIVIVDTPAALAVGDAIPLFRQVSGILLLGRVGVTTRESITQCASMIRNAQGMLLGVVATGVSHRRAYGYGYAYGQRRRRGSRWLPRRSSSTSVETPLNGNGAAPRERAPDRMDA